MTGLESILLAMLTGLVGGFVLSIPVGPINLTIMNEGALRGFKHAALIGLGASTMEIIYCSIAFTGFASFFTQDYIKTLMEVFSFGFMLFLGIRLLMVKTIETTGKMGGRVEEKFHPHSAFMRGLVQVMGNLNVLLSWIVLSASLISRGWVQPTTGCKGACVVGVFLGTGAWFSGLSYFVSLGRGKISERTLLWMQRGSGITLLLFAVFLGGEIAWEKHVKK
jgi:threonine/homoserine/homoserine lactone efflux protein